MIALTKGGRDISTLQKNTVKGGCFIPPILADIIGEQFLTVIYACHFRIQIGIRLQQQTRRKLFGHQVQTFRACPARFSGHKVANIWNQVALYFELLMPETGQYEGLGRRTMCC